MTKLLRRVKWRKSRVVFALVWNLQSDRVDSLTGELYNAKQLMGGRHYIQTEIPLTLETLYFHTAPEII